MYKNMLFLFFAVCLWSNFASAETRTSAQQFAKFEECPLASGQVIAPCRIGYRTYGQLNAEKSNAILVPTWYGGTSKGHAYLASPQVLDPDKYFIVIVDALANGVSSSPTNSPTQTDEKFPQIAITDMVSSQHRVLTETLGIESLLGVVGLSMGGMQAFEWAVRYPGFAQKTVVAIGSPRLPAFDIALWTTQNNLLALYRQCQCVTPLEVMSGMGMLSLVPDQLEQQVAREDTISTIISRGEARAARMANSWDQQRQAEAMIAHNIARDFDNDMQQAAAHTQTQFLIIVGEDDRVVTPKPALDFASIVDATVVVLDEDCGHNDPWCAPDEFATAVRDFINND